MQEGLVFLKTLVYRPDRSLRRRRNRFHVFLVDSRADASGKKTERNQDQHPQDDIHDGYYFQIVNFSVKEFHSDKNFLFCGNTIRKTVLCVKGIRDNSVVHSH